METIIVKERNGNVSVGLLEIKDDDRVLRMRNGARRKTVKVVLKETDTVALLIIEIKGVRFLSAADLNAVLDGMKLAILIDSVNRDPEGCGDVLRELDGESKLARVEINDLVFSSLNFRRKIDVLSA